MSNASHPPHSSSSSAIATAAYEDEEIEKCATTCCPVCFSGVGSQFGDIELLPCHCYIHYECMQSYIRHQLKNMLRILCPFGPMCKMRRCAADGAIAVAILPNASFSSCTDLLEIAELEKIIEYGRDSDGELNPLLLERLHAINCKPIKIEEIKLFQELMLNRSSSNSDKNSNSSSLTPEESASNADLDPLVKFSTKPCPNCTFRVSHYHGHACHHISPPYSKDGGCPQCHTHYCYKCGSTEANNIKERGAAHICLCGNWSNFCLPFDCVKSLELYLKIESGVPIDSRCGCPLCSDCSKGKPCSLCNGNCVVCKGYVNPGPKEFINENSSFVAVIEEKGKFRLSYGEYEGDIMFGIANGFGIFKYSDGSTYEGQWLDNKMNGKGEFKWYSGSSYNGDWIFDKRNGYGVYKWSTGNLYEGQFLNDKKHGLGKYKYADGSIYEGEYKEGNMHGKGKYTSNLGSVYEGEFMNDAANGVGKLIYENGTIFEGNWSSSKMQTGSLLYFVTQETYEAHCRGGDEIVDGFRVYDIVLTSKSSGEVFREGRFSNGRFVLPPTQPPSSEE